MSEPANLRNEVRWHENPGNHLFSAVPEQIARSRTLSVYAKAVALYIWSHKETFRQSAKGIHQETGMNRSTVAKGIAELEADGWLVRELIYRDGKTKPTAEIWHVQRSNIPFTVEQSCFLAGNPAYRVGRVDIDPAYDMTQPCLPDVHDPAYGVGNKGIHRNTVRNTKGQFASKDAKDAAVPAAVSTSTADPFTDQVQPPPDTTEPALAGEGDRTFSLDELSKSLGNPLHWDDGIMPSTDPNDPYAQKVATA